MTTTLDLDDDSAPEPKAALRVDPADAEFAGARAVSPERNGRHTAPAQAEPDPEARLIACCLIEDDNGAVLARCEEAGLIGDSFADSKLGVVYSRLQSMRREGKPILPATLATELKTAKELERVGGYDFIVAITSASATTAQAAYYIERVREMSIIREVDLFAKLTIEKTKGFTGGIDDFLAEQQARLKSVVEGGRITTRSPLRALTDFTIPRDGDTSILLGNRYLNRGDGAVLSGTSGMGKSSMSVQMATLFALGRPAFGIPPNGPMRSLIVQSEDSDGDVAEMQLSVAHALELSTVNRALVGSRVKVWTERVLRGDRFIAALRRKIEEFKPDLVWVNPLQAFIDGDVTDSQDLGRFLREGLNGVNDGQFGYIIVHHTTKPSTGKDKGERQWHEVMYDMAGGAEIINWARAILSLRAAETEGHFNLVLAKRGRRAGVTKLVEQGAGTRLEPVTTIPLAHAKGFIPAAQVGTTKDLPLIFWEPRAEDAKPEPDGKKGGRPEKYSFDDYRNLMPLHSAPGMEIGPLCARLITNKPIKKEVLHNCMKRWAQEGLVEVIATTGQPMRYRLPI